MKLCLAVTLFASCGLLGASAAVISSYDQRQQGELNVQIDLKDVQIIAVVQSDVFDDYVNYDYAYEYPDFTSKPGNKPNATTTNRPISTTISSTSQSTNLTTPLPSSSVSDDEKVGTTVISLDKTTSITTETTKESNVTESTTGERLSKNLDDKRICSSKFVMVSGRCRRKRISMLPFSMGRVLKASVSSVKSKK